MGALCCNSKAIGANDGGGFSSSYSFIKDPRLQDLCTHLKMLESKLNSNLTSIEDFKQLLVESKKPHPLHPSIALTLAKCEEALEEARRQLVVDLAAKKREVKAGVDLMDR